MKFRRIPGFPDYRVSRTGVVQSRKLYGSKIGGIGPWWTMKYKRSKKIRYPYVDLFFDVGKSKRFMIHQLVAITFIGPCPEGMYTRHLDDNPENNCLENLSYGTPTQNQLDSIKNGGRKVGEGSYQAKLTNQQVLEIRQLAKEITKDKMKFYSELAKKHGVRTHYIQKIVGREIWKHI